MRQVADDIALPNGMAVSADNSTLIVADSYRHSLVAFDIGPDGGLSGRRTWADLGEGTPDGPLCSSRPPQWRGMTEAQPVSPGSGQVLATDGNVPGAGWP